MKRKGEVIQSGHFMISSVTEENDDNIEDFRDGRDSPVLHEERLKLKMMRNGMSSSTNNNYHFSATSRKHAPIAIDGSLSRLFQCMSLAYEDGRLVSPKWKNFKGLKLSVKDKIRLNNAIWRTWYIQYVKQYKPLIQFATPFENESGEDSHTRPEAVIMEGKYWKRRIETVVAEYKKWRAFYTDNVRDTTSTSHHHHHHNTNQHMSMDDTMVTIHREADPMFSQGDQEPYNDLTTDTLFSCLSQPFHFPDPREMRATNSDMIQPGLLQFQPSFDDFPDLQLEPIQSTTSDWMNPPAKKMAVMSGQHHHHHNQHRQTMDDLSLNQSFNTELFTSSVMNQPMTSSTQVKKHHVSPHASSQPNDPLLSSIHNNTSAQQQQQTFKQPALHQPQKSSNPMLGASTGGSQQQKMVTTLTRTWVPDSNEFIPTHQQQQQQQQQANQQEMIYYDSSGVQAMSSVQQSQQPVKVITSRNFVVYKPPQQQQQVISKPNNVVQWQKLPQKQFGDQQMIPADMRVITPLPQASSCRNHQDRGKMTKIKQLLTQQQQQQQQQPKITIMEVATTNSNCDETRRRKHSSGKQQNYAKHPNNSISPQMTSPHMMSPVSVDMDVSVGGRGGGASPSGSVSNESTCSSSKQPRSGSFSTEQKRRFNIKMAFARLQSLIPGLNSPSSGAGPSSSSPSAGNSNKPLTKAATMGKANAYIKLMQADKQRMDDELAVLRGEVDKLKESIGLLQQQLPETGSSPNVSQPRSEDVARRFNAWIKQRAVANWKFYLFGPVIRPWFESYHQAVANSSNQTFTACVDEWVTSKCSLPQLRASIINSLQKLSVNTEILTDPHQLQNNISELIGSDNDITS